MYDDGRLVFAYYNECANLFRILLVTWRKPIARAECREQSPKRGDVVV